MRWICRANGCRKGGYWAAAEAPLQMPFIHVLVPSGAVTSTRSRNRSLQPGDESENKRKHSQRAYRIALQRKPPSMDKTTLNATRPAQETGTHRTGAICGRGRQSVAELVESSITVERMYYVSTMEHAVPDSHRHVAEQISVKDMGGFPK